MQSKRDRDQEKILNKIDELTNLVEELRVEVKDLKQKRDKRESNTSPAINRQSDSDYPYTRTELDNPDTTSTLEVGDICIILNKYKGLKGRTIVVSHFLHDQVNFTIDGRKSWRIRHNLGKIGHIPASQRRL